MTILLQPADPDFLWRSQIPPQSPDWYFVEVHRLNKWSAQLHLFHYSYEGIGICPVTWQQYPRFYVRHVKTWEEPFSLSFGALDNEIDENDIKIWERMAKDWIRQVKGDTTKHNTCAHATC